MLVVGNGLLEGLGYGDFVLPTSRDSSHLIMFVYLVIETISISLFLLVDSQLYVTR